MDKSQWIEEKMDIWRGAQYEETAEEFIKNSLEEAWTCGSMQGYKEGLHSKETVKKLVEHLRSK